MERKQRPKTPGRRLLSFQRRVKHDMGDIKGWRATKTIITSNTLSCQDKKQQTQTHTRSPRKTHSQSQRVISSFSPSICPCHTYKELVQQIHQLPLTSQCDPPSALLCSALCASWFRPAVAALAASGADPPHFNASDIYLGRTTGGRGGGGGRRRERLCAAPVDVDSPAVDFARSNPPYIHPSSALPPRCPACCVLLRRPCARDVCVICARAKSVVREWREGSDVVA